MGGRCIPPYANLFMARIEHNIFPDNLLILIWKRFIDDILFIFTGSLKELLTLMNNMNEMHPTIKYTFEYSQSQIAFLDTTVYIDQNRKLRTKLYKKPTDRSFLLHNDSHHPKHVKEGIIY